MECKNEKVMVGIFFLFALMFEVALLTCGGHASPVQLPADQTVVGPVLGSASLSLLP